ncbi:hypothetical protein GAPWKB30_0727 [Gilliamella apicola]|nr:hypothetical protein GAPWKB30_0727 [Gilliamella apicola]
MWLALLNVSQAKNIPITSSYIFGGGDKRLRIATETRIGI